MRIAWLCLCCKGWNHGVNDVGVCPYGKGWGHVVNHVGVCPQIMDAVKERARTGHPVSKKEFSTIVQQVRLGAGRAGRCRAGQGREATAVHAVHLYPSVLHRHPALAVPGKALFRHASCRATQPPGQPTHMLRTRVLLFPPRLCAASPCPRTRLRCSTACLTPTAMACWR